MKDAKRTSFAEFEKWRNKNKYYLCSGPFQRGIKEGWRASLEMVQRWYQEARDGRPQTFDLGLWDMLKQELDEN